MYMCIHMYMHAHPTPPYPIANPRYPTLPRRYPFVKAAYFFRIRRLLMCVC